MIDFSNIESLQPKPWRWGEDREFLINVKFYHDLWDHYARRALAEGFGEGVIPNPNVGVGYEFAVQMVIPFVLKSVYGD